MKVRGGAIASQRQVALQLTGRDASAGPPDQCHGPGVCNPATGAWAQGGAIYGPNGGAGAFSAYNPSTGSYAHGSAVWGPDGASGNASCTAVCEY